MAPKTSIDRALERERRKEERRQARREKKEQVNPNTASGTNGAVIEVSHNNAAQSPMFQGVDELAEMDDWGSAWQDAKEKGEGWGGRGKGGRGIQRNTWQPKDIFVEGCTLAYRGTELLERTTIRLGHGRRYGIVGANGVGKTTLLRRIAAGAVPGWPLHLRSYLVQQEEMAGDPNKNALEMVMTSDTRLTTLQREAEALEAEVEGSATSGQNPPTPAPAPCFSGVMNVAEGKSSSRVSPHPPQPPTATTWSSSSCPATPASSTSVAVAGGGTGDGNGGRVSSGAKEGKGSSEGQGTAGQTTADLSIEDKVARLEEIYEELNILDAHDADTRATSILKGLGFSDARIACPTSALSGGWMTRVSLACAIFCRPDLLLLDEPTNHLDLEGVVWLSRRLNQGIGNTMVLMVSHDAAFLDSVATDIIHFRQKQLSYYAGNYSAFLKTKADHDLAANRTQDTLDRQRKHMEESVKKMAKAASGKSGDQKKLGQVASRTKKLERHGFEKDPHGHRWKAQVMDYKGYSSIRAGSANESTQRGSRTTRRSLAAHIDKETVFKFPDITPLACGTDAPLIQCRDISFSFPPAAAPATAAPAAAGARRGECPSPPSSSSSSSFASKVVSIDRKTTTLVKMNGSAKIAGSKKGQVCTTMGGRSTNATAGQKVAALLEGVTLDLTIKSRIVLVGRNGSGKSTLLRLIASAAGLNDDVAEGGSGGMSVAALQPTSGTIVRHHNARVGLFTQECCTVSTTEVFSDEELFCATFAKRRNLKMHHAERLRMTESPVQHMKRLFEGVKDVGELELRRQLGCCGISGSLALQEMRSLSGGQKSRVVLAELMMRHPHVLLLDEPTNHLDLPSIDALKLALQGYGGGIVLASHDQALISDILESSGSDVDGDLGGGGARGELWEVKGHRVRRRDGGVEEYVEEVARQAEQKEARRKVADGK